VIVRKVWPHIGLIDRGGSWGTGFLVQGEYVLTALHVVGKANRVPFKMSSGLYDAEVVAPFPNDDLAVLKLSRREGEADIPQLPPLKLRTVERLPLPFVGWGFGLRTPDGVKPLLCEGEIKAMPGGSLLQLEAKSLLKGMSGGPLAIDPASDAWTTSIPAEQVEVVGIIHANYAAPADPLAPVLGYACSFSGLPSDLYRALGGEASDSVVEHDIRQRRIARSHELWALVFVLLTSSVAVMGLLDLFPRSSAVGIVTVGYAIAASLWASARRIGTAVRIVRSQSAAGEL
jgi:hypothetical protein